MAEFKRYTYNGVTVSATGRRSSSRDDKKYERSVRYDDREVTVHYGDPDMPMRRNNEEARDAFLSRHSCDTKKDPTEAGFWACYDWANPDEGVSEMEAIPTQAIVIREQTTFRGSFPTVPLFPAVDTSLLHENDPNPMYLTLRVCEYPRVSENGLVYDKALVEAIAEQMPGCVGIRGHIPSEQADVSYPLPEAYWVGCVLEGNVLYGKAYVPPGATRESFRRLKAIGGGVGTSIYGRAVQQMNDDGTWRAEDFMLQQIDFTDPEGAALHMGGDFIITAESRQDSVLAETRSIVETALTITGDDYTAPEKTTVHTTQEIHEMAEEKSLTIHDVPDTLKRQIIEESKQAIVSEATRRAEAAEKLIKEMGDVTAHVKLNIPDGADPMERITAMTEFLSGLQTAFGQDVSVEMLTNMKAEGEAMAAQVDALDAENFEAEMDKEIDTYMESWHVSSETGKTAIANIKRLMKRAALAETKKANTGKRDRDAMKTALTALWENEFKPLAETARDSLSGGRAYVGGTDNRVVKVPTLEEQQRARAKLGI